MVPARSPYWLLRAVATSLLAVAVLAPHVASASDSASVEEGRLLYRVHCLACHGESARGNGPLGHQLEISPPDLTRFRQRNAGRFPSEEIQETIDGRRPLSAHGRREMPVWGLTFQTLGRDTDQEAEVRGRITALTRYLESIQEPIGP